nr:MAG: hypothetical protein 1 [Marnaviridae sp.]
MSFNTLKNNNETIKTIDISEDLISQNITLRGNYSYCHNCGSIKFLHKHSKCLLFFTNQCTVCTKNIIGFQNQSLTHAFVEAKYDIKNWLYSNKYKNKSFISSYINIPSEIEEHINLLEDLCILMHNFCNSSTLSDRVVSIITFCKLRGNRPHLYSGIMDFCSTVFQETYTLNPANIARSNSWDNQHEEFYNIFADLRQYTNIDKIKDMEIFKKLHKLFLYILTCGLLNWTNISFTSLQYTKYEEAALRRDFAPGLSLTLFLIDTILYVCDKGMQLYKTGDVSCIIHSSSSYSKWASTAMTLIKQSTLLSNPEPHGVDRSIFLDSLKDTIEKGKAISKFTMGLDKAERMYIQKILNDLQMVESELLTKKAAQMPRKDPFAILIHGSSNICKSQLKQILFYHYAKAFNLNPGMEFMYTRCPTDEYWSGFNSTQWCIVMDDIAFLKPNNEVDPTLKEMLQIKNSVPYSPPQAALEDKGRTPVVAKLLIGTTNTQHLNLKAYFACPFAIARRMSYILTAHVKPEYTKHSFMADSNKIPVTRDGEYMNIWNFSVSVPVPQSDHEMDNQQTKYEVKHTFTEINDMLAWYISVAKEHEESQDKASKAEETMKNIEVCQTCYRPVNDCRCMQSQSGNIEEATRDMSLYYKLQLYLIDKIVTGLPNTELYDICLCYYNLFSNHGSLLFVLYFGILSICYVSPMAICVLFILHNIYFFFWKFIQEYYRLRYGMLWKYQLIYSLLKCKTETTVLLFRLAGKRVNKIYFSNRTILALKLFLSSAVTIKALHVFFTTYTNVIPYRNAYKKKKNYAQNSDVFKEDGATPKPMEEERPAFYYHDPYRVTDIDISGASKATPYEEVKKKLKSRSARFNFRFDLSPGKVSTTTAINVKGHLWLFNKHTLKNCDFTLEIILDDVTCNITRNIKPFRIHLCEVIQHATSDLAMIKIVALPPGPDLYKYFPIDKIIHNKMNGEYIMKNLQGELELRHISNIRVGVPEGIHYEGYFGNVIQDTQRGDCGSACLVKTSNSVCILGIHSMGNNNGMVVIQHVSQGILDDMLKHFDFQVESGSEPISMPGYDRQLKEVHDKSSLRWIERGTANIMGSFVGFRAKNKSKVQKTLICDTMVNLGYNADYVAPNMSWLPWHNGLKEMLTLHFDIDNLILEKCRKSFYNDIKNGLGDKIKELKVYSTDVALNGVEGVAFVDRINTSTSAGNPLKTTKKKFITFDENNHIEDLDPIIKSRMEEILRTYKQGKRFNPQFCTHLKDEPVTKKKQKIGKTRLFCGAEFAWSIIVRRYFLSFIRLMQNNPYIFESMVGIAAQSIQWEQLYRYIIKHGIKKLIAGDYKAFDKRMLAAFILEAFKIFEDLAKEAGWSEEDIRILRCIAIDTAYAHIEFNGDYIEIQGNPSGHPLTVIINCIVNSLYMRYAYIMVSGKDISTFKDNVNLATYGDDNIMSVSDNCPNFNHTTISQALSTIGVTYTMAEKEAESVPYIHVDDTSFLKRSFRQDDDVGAILAPLAHESFDKMLTAYVNNDNISMQSHSIYVIETALREYFFYGKDIFLQKRDMFITVIKKCKLEMWVRDSTLPKYHDLCYEFWMRFDNKANAQKYYDMHKDIEYATLKDLQW